MYTTQQLHTHAQPAETNNGIVQANICPSSSALPTMQNGILRSITITPHTKIHHAMQTCTTLACTGDQSLDIPYDFRHGKVGWLLYADRHVQASLKGLLRHPHIISLSFSHLHIFPTSMHTHIQLNAILRGLVGTVWVFRMLLYRF